jgi:peptidoglycan/LPS O-acetylase OafA/YrhL
MKQRIEQLDSLRGLAALTVVICHFTNLLPAKPSGENYWWNLIRQSPLSGLMAGHEAVILFFVLSGFVLSIPFFRKSVPYTPWITKRFFRIYLPYYGAILLAMLLVVACNPQPISTLPKWFNGTFQGPITGRVILDHLLLVGSFRNSQFNPIVWSLVVEMRISLLFPLLIAAVVRLRRWWQSLAAAYLLAGIGCGLYLLLNLKLKWATDYPLTLLYIPQFVTGCLLARHQEPIVAWYRTLSRDAKSTLLLSATFLYTYPYWCFPEQRLLHRALPDDFFPMLGVGIFIVTALGSSSISHALLSRPLVILGKTSYSLYLVHATCLMTSMHLLFGKIPLWSILLVAAGSSAAMTVVFYFGLELPSIELGKWVSGLLAPRPATRENETALPQPLPLATDLKKSA